jgi:DNA-binding transcriptional regulator YiaG
MAIRNNHVFKGHKTLLGSRYVTYAEVELPVKYELFSKAKDGFDWGYNGSSSIQLAFSMLHQLSDVEFATEYAPQFCHEVVKSLNSRDWILNAADVVEWIEKNSDESRLQAQSKTMSMVKPPQKAKKVKRNVVKDVCRELSITQKNLAEILEVPEGTVSSWAVKNEIPRLGKKAIEFYIQNRKNQEVVDSYKNFVKLLQSA